MPRDSDKSTGVVTLPQEVAPILRWTAKTKVLSLVVETIMVAMVNFLSRIGVHNYPVHEDHAVHSVNLDGTNSVKRVASPVGVPAPALQGSIVCGVNRGRKSLRKRNQAVHCAAYAITALVLLFGATSAEARNRAFGFCEVGDQSVVVSGLNGTPKVQGSYPGCTVTVYNTGTLVLATIFSDDSGTPLANPFTASSSTGYWFFYADASRYDVVISGGGLVTPFTFADYPLTSGIGSITVGDLPPIFTTMVTNPTTAPVVSYTLTSAAAKTVLANCTGAPATPSYCAITNAMMPAPGSSKDIIYDTSSLFDASAQHDITWDNTAKSFIVSTGGVPLFKLRSDSGAARLEMSNVQFPLLENNTGTGWFITSQTNQDFRIGPSNDPDSFVIASGLGGVFGLNPGTVRHGTGSANGTVLLNDGSSSAGVFQGPGVTAGTPAPETNFAARVGSIFLNATGGPGTSAYMKGSGTGMIGWNPIPVLQSCGTAAAGSAAVCSTPTSVSEFVVGTVAMDGSSPSTATITALPSFTGTQTYACVVTGQSDRTDTFKAINVSATSFTITGPDASTSVVSYLCAGS